jgi:Mce-associated membrane protein
MTDTQCSDADQCPASAADHDDDQPDLSSDAATSNTASDNGIQPAPDIPDTESKPMNRPNASVRVCCSVLVPLLAILFAGAAAYLKYVETTAQAAGRAAVESVQAAKESTTAMLSYTPDTVEQNLTAARDRLTGTFRDSYTALTRDVVMPGAKDQRITATATVPAAASVSASANHAVVLVFVNQAIIIGNDTPTQTASVVEVTLENLGNRWLVSGFDPK